MNRRAQTGVTEKVRAMQHCAAVVLISVLLIVGETVGSDSVDFDTQIMPLLTKQGCNAGSCHGAAIGRGGAGSTTGASSSRVELSEGISRCRSPRPDCGAGGDGAGAVGSGAGGAGGAGDRHPGRSG